MSLPLSVCESLCNHMKINFQTAMALSSYLFLLTTRSTEVSLGHIREFARMLRSFLGPPYRALFFCLCFLWEVHACGN